MLSPLSPPILGGEGKGASHGQESIKHTSGRITNIVSVTCSVPTAPAITVTLACPPASVATGALITYSGTVRNSGNITLNNVTVVNSQTSPNTGTQSV